MEDFEKTNDSGSLNQKDQGIDSALYEQVCLKNRELSEKLEKMEKEIQAREDHEKGKQFLAGLLGQNKGELFEKAMEKAETEELSNLPPEKRWEFAYLLCLGEESHKARKNPSSALPKFAPSSGNGQVMLTAENKPTTFAMAKENAKRYFNLK